MNEKDLEESRRDLIEVLLRHLPTETEENMNVGEDCRCPFRDSNCAPLKGESRVPLLRHSVRVYVSPSETKTSLFCSLFKYNSDRD
jgi:hypothetical protein